jgi:ribosomal protein S18 acetylase RimI-like enzyme
MREDSEEWRVALDVGEDEAYAVLARDRVWSCFAIADLVPPFRAYSRVAVAYHAGSADCAACLVVRHAAMTVVSPYGAPAGVAAILAQLTLPQGALIQARAEHLSLIARYYRCPAGWRPMLRMAVTAATLRPPASSTPRPMVSRLGMGDVRGLHDLYARYPESHFCGDEVEHGLFYGIHAGSDVVAAGGTHVVAERYGIAVLGSIFTCPEVRGRGYARTITFKLASDLVRRGCRDVVLNVAADNASAIHVYHSLGFQTHCPYVTGAAVTGAAQCI